MEPQEYTQIQKNIQTQGQAINAQQNQLFTNIEIFHELATPQINRYQTTRSNLISKLTPGTPLLVTDNTGQHIIVGGEYRLTKDSDLNSMYQSGIDYRLTSGTRVKIDGYYYDDRIQNNYLQKEMVNITVLDGKHKQERGGIYGYNLTKYGKTGRQTLKHIKNIGSKVLGIPFVRCRDLLPYGKNTTECKLAIVGNDKECFPSGDNNKCSDIVKKYINDRKHSEQILGTSDKSFEISKKWGYFNTTRKKQGEKCGSQKRVRNKRGYKFIRCDNDSNLYCKNTEGNSIYNFNTPLDINKSTGTCVYVNTNSGDCQDIKNLVNEKTFFKEIDKDNYKIINNNIQTLCETYNQDKEKCSVAGGCKYNDKNDMCKFDMIENYQQNLEQNQFEIPDSWQVVTNELGQSYYWNRKTGETSWERPPNMSEPDPFTFTNGQPNFNQLGRQSSIAGGSRKRRRNRRSKKLSRTKRHKTRRRRRKTRRRRQNTRKNKKSCRK